MSSEDAGAGTSGATTKPKTVRITVDLAPETHRNLKRWLNASAVEMDRADVPAAEAIRVLLAELLDESDSTLSDRVRAEMKNRRA